MVTRRNISITARLRKAFGFSFSGSLPGWKIRWQSFTCENNEANSTGFAMPSAPAPSDIARAKTVRAILMKCNANGWAGPETLGQDQSKYFARSAHRDHEKLHGHERTITRLFISALLFALVQDLFFKEDNQLICLRLESFPFWQRCCIVICKKMRLPSTNANMTA